MKAAQHSQNFFFPPPSLRLRFSSIHATFKPNQSAVESADCSERLVFPEKKKLSQNSPVCMHIPPPSMHSYNTHAFLFFLPYNPYRKGKRVKTCMVENRENFYSNSPYSIIHDTMCKTFLIIFLLHQITNHITIHTRIFFFFHLVCKHC